MGILGFMNTDFEIHPVQAEILRKLLFMPVARFSQLNLMGLENDHFSFHLRRLVELGFVEKTPLGYGLTAAGKELANRMDTDNRKIERQPKTAVLVIPRRIVGGTVEYLFQERLKQPYFGYHGFVSGKIKWGERVLEAALRELNEETGLEGEVRLVGIEHKIDNKNGALLEDKYFYVIVAEKVKGQLVKEFEGGRNLWMSKSEVKDLSKVFPDVHLILKVAAQNRLQFLEKTWEVEEY